MPTMITAAIRIEIHVFRLLRALPSVIGPSATYPPLGPRLRADGASARLALRRGSRSFEPARPAWPARPAGLFHQTTRFIDGSRIVVALAKRDRLPEFLLRGGAVAGLDRELAELEARSRMDPLARLERQRGAQIGIGLRRPAERRARGAALVSPQRILAEHPRTAIGGEAREPVVDEPLRVGSASGAQIRRSRLEPHETILRILLPQLRELVERLGIALLAVIYKDKREPRV